MSVVACRSCGASHLPVFLSLGETPLANSLLNAHQLSEQETTYPLELAVCPACTLVQITETVPPEKLFREYVYFSSYSDTMLRHAREIAERLIRVKNLNPASRVVEIASNDGYLLQYFAGQGVPVLGIEPARNIARVANDRGIPTVAEFFDRTLAEKLAAEGGKADLILANNVMAHIPDINGVVAGVKALLKPDGVFVMETPYVKDFIDRVEFDTIYHEHLFYYSATALDQLFQRHGLAIADVERIPIHGGSLRVTVAQAGREGDCAAVRAMLAAELAWGVNHLDFYSGYAERVARVRRNLRALLGRLKAEKKRIAAYGAAAKGSTLLNAFQIGPEFLDFVVDRSPHKQGKFMPGVHLPILPVEALLERTPDYVLLLAWNLAEEIMEQQSEYRGRGGRFIIPVPEPHVV
jgi:SAM-dependent methyltransferase